MAVFSSQNTMNGHRSPNFDYISIVIAQLKPDQPVAQTLITRFGFSLSEKKSSFFDLQNSLLSFSDSFECWNEHLKSSLVHLMLFVSSNDQKMFWKFQKIQNQNVWLTFIQVPFQIRFTVWVSLSWPSWSFWVPQERFSIQNLKFTLCFRRIRKFGREQSTALQFSNVKQFEKWPILLRKIEDRNVCLSFWLPSFVSLNTRLDSPDIKTHQIPSQSDL